MRILPVRLIAPKRTETNAGGHSTRNMDELFPIRNGILIVKGKFPHKLRPINQIANPHPLYHLGIIYASSKTKIR